MALERVYSIEETAAALRISRFTVQKYLSLGRLQRTKVGARTLIKESSIARLMVDGGVSPAPVGRRNASAR